MTSPRSSLFGVVALSFVALSPAVLAITGDPVPDVDVSLERRPGRLVRQVKTDPHGNFNFGFVQEGDYVITVRPGSPPHSRQVRSDGNPAVPGSTAKSSFESRSSTTSTSGASPLRFQVSVNGASTGPATRTIEGDAAQQIPVNTAGGQLGGRITAQ